MKPLEICVVFCL